MGTGSARPYSGGSPYDLPAQGRRRTRITRTIDGFRLLAAVSVAAAVMTVRVAAVFVGRIVGAGTEK